MAGSFDAKVDISTADAIANLRLLKTEVQANSIAMKEFNQALIDSKGNVQQAATQMTQLAQARRQNTAVTKEETQATIAAARETAIRTTAEAKVEETLARKANQEAQAAKATEQGNLASERAAAAALKNAKSNSDAADSTKKMGDSLANTRYLMYDVGATLGILSAATLALPAATAAVAASYQKDFAQVLRITDQSGQSAVDLQNKLMQVGQTIPLSFGNLTEIAQLGAHLQLGNDGLAAFTETAAKFVAVTGVTNEQGAQMFSRMRSSMQDAAQAGNGYFNQLGSSIAQVGTVSVATDAEVTTSISGINAVTAAVGMSTPATVGLGAALANLRVPPEMARGALTRIFANFNRDSADAVNGMTKFSGVMNMSSQSAAALWKSDPTTFFNKLIEGLHTAYTGGQNLTTLFDSMGVKNVRDVNTLTRLAIGYDVLNKSMTSAQDGYAKGTALDELSKPVMDNLIAKLQLLANAWANLGAHLGGPLLPLIGHFVDTLAGVATTIDDLVTHVPGVGILITALLGFMAVTGVFLGMKAAQAFVVAGLVSFQEMAGKTSVTAAMSLTGVLKELGRTFQLLSGQSKEAAAGVGASTAAMDAATPAAERLNAASGSVGTSFGSKALSGVKAFGSGLLSLAGGPIGVAIVGLTALVSSIVDSGIKAQEAGQTIADAMARSADEGMSAIAKKLAEKKVTWTDGIALGNLDKDVTQVANEVGIGFDKVVASIAKGKDGVADFDKQLQAFAKSKGVASVNDLSFGDAGRLNYLKQIVADYTAQTAKAADTSTASKDALAQLGVKAAGAGDAIEATAADTKTMDTALKNMNDTIFGSIDAQNKLQGSLQKVGEGLAKSGSYNLGDENGRANVSNLESAMQDAQKYYQQLMADGTASAQQAAQSYKAFVDQLIQKIRDTGGDPTPMIQLAEQSKKAFQDTIKGGPTPTIAVTADAAPAQAKAVAAPKSVQDFIDAQGVPTIGVNAITDVAQEKIRSIALNLAKITGYPYQVVLDALTKPGADKANEVKALLKSIENHTYVAPVNANTSAFVTNIQNAVAYAKAALNSLNGQTQATSNALAALRVPGFNAGATGAPASIARPVDNSPAAPTQVATPTVTDNSAADAANAIVPPLNAVGDGYDKVADKAQKAAAKQKQGWQDTYDGITQAEAAIKDYSNRLKTGMDAAFQRQYGLSIATDAYYTQLDAINKKRADELKQVDDLTTKIKDLNNARDKDLIDANKAKIEQSISIKYGEGDRAASYGNTAQTALDNAAAKQKEINTDIASRQVIQDGIGTLTGYSAAAIANRQALRDLETKTIDMIAAYAAQGHSIQEVKTYAAQLTAQFQTDAGQVSTNRAGINNLIGDLGRYINIINAVPYVKPTTITADTGQAMNALNALGGARDWVTRPGELNISTQMFSDNMDRIMNRFAINLQATLNDPAGSGSSIGGRQNGSLRGGAYTGGQVASVMQGFASGGQIPGTPPSNPRVDNLMAKVDGGGMIRVRSKEFIQPQEAVDYYGLDFMNSIRTMSLPKFNGGGSVGGFSGGSGGGNGVTVVQLNSESLAALQKMNTPVYLMTEDRIIAESASRGNVVLASQGHS